MGPERTSSDRSLHLLFTSRGTAATSMDVGTADTRYPEVLCTPRTHFERAWECQGDDRRSPAIVRNGNGDDNDKDSGNTAVFIIVGRQADKSKLRDGQGQ